MSSWVLQTALAGITDPQQISNDLLAYTEQPAPAVPHAWLAASIPGGSSAAAALPITVPAAGVRTGALLHSYVDDFYNRIHVDPQHVDMGNVVSIQTFPVAVWNAHFVPRSLVGFSGLEEGLQLSGQAEPPVSFAGNQERSWQMAVTPQGNPVLDARVGWVFDNAEQPVVRITANRIVAWTFKPDWESGILERLSWLTDIHQSESLAEQRRAMRLAPRREWEANMLVEGRERQLLDLALFGWGARIWVVPVWPDIQLMTTELSAGVDFIPCATAHLDFRAGGLALLSGDSAFDYEVVEIDQVLSGGLQLKRDTQQGWLRGSRIYPCRTAQLIEQPDLTRLTDRLMSVDVHFLASESCEWPAQLPAATYRSHPVYEVRPDESEDLTQGFVRLMSDLDNRMAQPLMQDVAGIALPVTGHRRLLAGRAERAGWRSFLYAMRGRQQAVWVPSHADDLRLVSVVLQTQSYIDVENCGYSRFGLAQAGRKDIRIELRSGTVFYRRISSAQELSAAVERLVINAPLGQEVAPAAVVRISWMALMRLDADVIELEHQTDSEGIATSSVVFRGVRDDEL